MPEKKNKGKLIIIIIMTVIILLLAFVGNSRAENEDWPVIPVPSQSWEDYQSQHPIITPEPTPTSEPTSPPRPIPPLVGATAFYRNARLRSYKVLSYNEYPDPAEVYYQALSSPYSQSSTIPTYASVAGTVLGSQVVWDSNDRSGSHPVLNSTDSVINFVDSYIQFDWELRFMQSTTISQGYGLDYKYFATVSLSYNVQAYNHNTGDLVTNIPIRLFVKRMWDDGTSDGWMEESVKELAQLRNGITLYINSDKEDCKLAKIILRVCIGMSDQTIVQDNGMRAAQLYYLNSGSSGMELYCGVNHMPTSLEDISNTISESFLLLRSWFIPTQASVESWLNAHLQSMDLTQPMNLYYNAFLTMLSNIVNSDVQDFLIKIPALKINIGGNEYQWFNGYEYNMDQADIELTGQGGNTLFFYTRLAGDVLIVGACFNVFVYKLWKRIFDVNYASGAEDKS